MNYILDEEQRAQLEEADTLMTSALSIISRLTADLAEQEEAEIQSQELSRNGD